MNDAPYAVSDIMERLSTYMAAAVDRALPDEVTEKARHHILDTLAAMVSGSKLKPGRLAIALVRQLGGREEALVAGSDVVTTAIDAALANGILAHADETDDSHPGSFSHPGCAVVPAALAMAERGQCSGTALLRAVVLGYDIGARTTMSLGVDRFYGGHHSTHSFAAQFGAAAAAGALAGLGAEQMRWLLSYTAQQASGIACWNRDGEHVEKAFDFGGMGARDGVTAAVMVAAGFSGVDDVFSGPRNFFDAFGGEPEGMGRELGETYEIMNAAIKKWSVGSPIQAPLESLGTLMADHGIKADDIARIEVRICTAEAHVVDDRAMPDICLQHLLALLVVDGTVGFASSHDYQRMAETEIQAVRGKIELIYDPDMIRRAGAVRLTTGAGDVFDHLTRHVRGTAANPMTRDEVGAKARDLMAPILGADRTELLVARIWDLEGLDSADELRP
ncbi:MAG: MmgE/PrpD family protein, partial [Alphaproteobacteria bacterium]